jgi:hypothetical protein
MIVNTMCVLYTQWRIIRLEQNKIMLFVGKWKEMEAIMLSEISQKDKCHMFFSLQDPNFS